MVLYSHHRPPHITTLPSELIDEIAFNIACDSLLGLPGCLTPFILTCKRTYEVIMGDNGGKAVWRKIFKQKFSWSAAERRGRRLVAEKQRPIGNDDYLFQLRLYVKTLKDVGNRVGLLRRRRPRAGGADGQDTNNGGDETNNSDDSALSEPDTALDDSQTIEELMWVLWVMCLEDDGCNRIQMDRVGVYDWVEAFVRRRLYEGAIEGWPSDNAVNSCALHVLWFLTTKERLFAESEQSREELVRLVLPFVTIPFRYASAFAPPNHFELPPPSSGPDSTSSHSRTTSIPTPHGPYPIYLSPSHRVWNHVFYNQRVPTTIPLITDAAKLLHGARRELFKIPIMPDFPRNRYEMDLRNPGKRVVVPTQEDFEEFNEVLLGGEAIERHRPDVLPTNASGRRARWGKGGGTMLPALPPVVYRLRSSSSSSSPPQPSSTSYSPDRIAEIVEVDESACTSRNWDKDWWRLRKCLNCLEDTSYLLEQEELEFDDGASTVTCTSSEDASTCVGGDDYVPHTASGYGLNVNERVYTRGELTGLWAGKIFLPSETHFNALINALPAQPDTDRPPTIPDNFSETTLGPLVSVPVYMRLREHKHITSPYTSSDVLLPEGGMSNAWFPEGSKPIEDRDAGKVMIPSGIEKFVYETLNGLDGFDSDNEEDIIVTGETDPRHGQAWHHYRFYGRVRKWDGCVALLRIPVEDPTVNSGKGSVLFYGSLVGGGKNFVGNWRVANAPDEYAPAWEGAFSLGRREEF